MFNTETTSFQPFSQRIPNLKIFLTSDFKKGGQNRPQNLVHEKGTDNNTRTLQLLDQIGPVGRFDENCIMTDDKPVFW